MRVGAEDGMMTKIGPVELGAIAGVKVGWLGIMVVELVGIGVGNLLTGSLVGVVLVGASVKGTPVGNLLTGSLVGAVLVGAAVKGTPVGNLLTGSLVGVVLVGLAVIGTLVEGNCVVGPADNGANVEGLAEMGNKVCAHDFA